MNGSLKAVELFAGIGGFRLAVDRLGIDTIWANDFNSDACKVYRDNFGEQSIVEGDINLLIEDVPPHDLLTGGFPCQPFSRAGKKLGVDDYRGTLFEAIVKILLKQSPKYFVLENVNSLLFMDHGRNFSIILRALTKLDYKIEWRVLGATMFGLPQNRWRVVITGKKSAPHDCCWLLNNVAELDDAAKFWLTDFGHWKEITGTSQKFHEWGMAKNGRYVSCDLKSGEYPKCCLQSILQQNVDDSFDFTEDTINRIKDSVFVNKLVNGVRLLYNQAGGARMGYTVFGTDGVSPTLTASTSRHYERYKIGDKFRRLTNVEYARLQGFPDNHCKAVSTYDQYRLYGNAVPHQLVEFAIQKLTKDKAINLKESMAEFALVP